MSATTTITPLGGFRNETPYPFCPGCGHGSILDALNAALAASGRDPREVVIVSDIGCSGLSDQYFATNAFHGLHGRSVTYATGVKLARPELTVIVVMGDGGTGIGGTHLVNAARRNVGLTVLVFNNFNFGMTGGQHSTTTPPGALTPTTPTGAIERPLDVCTTVGANGAAYAWRGTSSDPDLPQRISEALDVPGFALLDIWEPCTAYFAPRNKLNKKALQDLAGELGFGTGILYRHDGLDWSTAHARATEPMRGQPTLAPRPIEARWRSTLDRPVSLVVAGSAGGRVRTAVRRLAEAALASGLWAVQSDDYPVTVKTGHSLSQLLLSPEEMLFAGPGRPDAVVLLSEDGRRKMAGTLARLGPEARIFALPGLADAGWTAPVTVVDPVSAGVRGTGGAAALFATATAARALGLVPDEALAGLDGRGDEKGV